MNIEQLSGDSTVRQLQWIDGRVSFLFEDGETDELYRIELVTKLLYSEATEETGSVHVILPHRTIRVGAQGVLSALGPLRLIQETLGDVEVLIAQANDDNLIA